MFEELNSKNILITGATGLIGQDLTKFAFQNNMNVIATVVDEYGIERTDAVIRVSTNGELRGEAIAPNYESEYFLTV